MTLIGLDARLELRDDRHGHARRLCDSFSDSALPGYNNNCKVAEMMIISQASVGIAPSWGNSNS